MRGWLSRICWSLQEVQPFLSNIYLTREIGTTWIESGSPMCYSQLRKQNLRRSSERQSKRGKIDLRRKTTYWSRWGRNSPRHFKTAWAFHVSQFLIFISYYVEHGRASMLLKSTSKRKRTREELEDVKMEEDALKEDRHSILQMVKRLKQEHAEMMEAL